MSADQQKVTIKLPAGIDPDDYEAVGEDIVGFIRDRTDVGFGVRKRGRGFSTYAFPEYTPEYEAFKGQSKVDLKLSGELLDELRVLEVDPDSRTVTIGYEEGDPINGKAEGNFTGSYGKKRPNPAKARNILGMTKEELDAVAGVYRR